MPSNGMVLVRVIAKVRALLSGDWSGRAGRRFRQTTQQLSNFAEKHGLRPDELADEVVVLGRRKLEGLANREYAAAVKDFADSERTKIEIELQRRTMESRARKEEADAKKAEAEAELARLELIKRKAILLKELQEIGVIVHVDGDGNYSVLPLPEKFSLLGLTTNDSPTSGDNPDKPSISIKK